MPFFSQVYEYNLLYRNHILVFRAASVEDTQHRYFRGMCYHTSDGEFFKAAADHFQATPPASLPSSG